MTPDQMKLIRKYCKSLGKTWQEVVAANTAMLEQSWFEDASRWASGLKGKPTVTELLSAVENLPE